MPAPRFVHLRLHSEYSVTDGIVRIDDAVRARGRRRHAGAGAHRPRQPVRHGQVLPGGARRRASSRSSAPTAGCRTTPTATSRSASLLLCSSRAGYLRLCELLSRAWLQQPAPRPRRDRAGLARKSGTEGLIALSGARRRRRRPGAGRRQRRSRPSAARARWAAAVPRPLLHRAAARRACRSGEALVGTLASPLAGAPRPAGGGDPPGAVPRARRLQRARGARLHRGGLRAGRPAPAEALHAASSTSRRQAEMAELFADLPAGARELGRDRAALQPRDRARQEPAAGVPDAATA